MFSDGLQDVLLTCFHQEEEEQQTEKERRGLPSLRFYRHLWRQRSFSCCCSFISDTEGPTGSVCVSSATIKVKLGDIRWLHQEAEHLPPSTPPSAPPAARWPCGGTSGTSGTFTFRLPPALAPPPYRLPSQKM